MGLWGQGGTHGTRTHAVQWTGPWLRDRKRGAEGRGPPGSLAWVTELRGTKEEKPIWGMMIILRHQDRGGHGHLGEVARGDSGGEKAHDSPRRWDPAGRGHPSHQLEPQAHPSCGSSL